MHERKYHPMKVLWMSPWGMFVRRSNGRLGFIRYVKKVK